MTCRDLDAAQRPTECPRCGYDLAGTVRTWGATCPIHGRCQECGLEFEWGRIFLLSEHPWLFDYNWRRHTLRRLVTTLTAALRPRRFWREVQLTDPIHVRPALFVGALMLASGLLGLFLARVYTLHAWQSSLRWWRGGNRAQGIDYAIGLLRDTLEELPVLLARAAPALVVVVLGMPLLFALAPVTLRRARVRSGHILRIWAYSLAAPAFVACAWLGLWVVLDWLDLAAASWLDPWRWRGVTAYSSAEARLIGGMLPGLVLSMLAFGWNTLWWTIACREYLRLPGSGRMIGLLAVVLVLAACVAQVTLGAHRFW